MISFREYHLTQLSRFFAASKTFTNPIRRTTPAYYLLEALQNVGTNKYHPVDQTILNEFRRIVGSISRADGLTFLEYYEGTVGQKNKYSCLKDMLAASLVFMSRKNSDISRRLKAQKSAIETKKDNGKMYVCLNTRYYNCSGSTKLIVTANQPKTSMNKVLLFVKTSFTNVYKWLSGLYGLKKGGR